MAENLTSSTFRYVSMYNIFLISLIRPSKSGYYYIRDKKHNYSKSTGTKSKKLAQKYLQEYENLGFDKYNISPILCSDFKDEFIRVSKALNKSKGQLMNIACCFNELHKFFGNRNLDSYNVRDINRFIVHKIEKTSAATARRHIATLRPAFKYALKQRYIHRNPFEDCLEIDVPKPTIHYLSVEDFAKLLGVINNDFWKDFAVFAVRAGMPLSEILYLKISDINIESKFILVRSNEEHLTKNRHSAQIELADELLPIIKKYSHQIYLFENPEYHKNFTKDFVSHKFIAFKRKAGLNEKFSFKALRATYTTWLLNAGVSKEYLQSQLRHSSITMLEKHYGFYDKTIYRGDVNKFEIIKKFANQF